MGKLYFLDDYRTRKPVPHPEVQAIQEQAREEITNLANEMADNYGGEALEYAEQLAPADLYRVTAGFTDPEPPDGETRAGFERGDWEL